MKLTRDLFIIFISDDLYLVYAPIKRVLAKINKDAVNIINFIKEHPNLEIDSGKNPNISSLLNFLNLSGLADEKEYLLPPEPKANLDPTEIILLPTYNCNLRCVYCYANSGDASRPIMKYEMARSAVDLAMENSIKKETRRVTLAFHGGGEPTLAWSLVTELINYAKAKANEKNIDLRSQITSNGILSNEQLEWIVNNNISIQISFDGPSDIQNIQRPMIGGEKSYSHVLRTIQFFNEKRHPFGIQTVITKYSVKRMVEIVDFFHKVSSIKELHFEPLFVCGRCIYSGWEEPSAEIFITEYLNAWKHAASLSIILRTSLSRLETLHSIFCGAVGQNFIVTPEGNITACLEVPSFNDKRSETLIYGSYNPEKKDFVIDKNKLIYLASRNIFNLPSCKNCFAAWHCAGDCLAKSLSLGNMFDPTQTERCFIAKSLMIEQLKTILSDSEIGKKLGIKVSEF